MVDSKVTMRAAIAAITRVEAAVVAALRGAGPKVLAVSGGRDSMVLLDAASRSRSGASPPLIASFDHGTGPAASRAVELVAAEAALRGLQCVIGHAVRRHTTEAGWREERWRFLRDVASASGAGIVTAHTLNDQIETVFIRILRDSGARGLAGLYAPSDVGRPLLALPRADVARYASARALRYVEDPTNLSRRHLRNRVRLDLLPALSAVRPRLSEELLETARRAAAWREGLAAVVDRMHLMFLDPGTVRIAAEFLVAYDAPSLRILWPEVAARAGVTMDRRGTERAAEFTIQRLATGGRFERLGRGGRGQVIQLAGGAEIEFIGGAFVLRRS
jgi:tRNA(Ile)-lysidine synthase